MIKHSRRRLANYGVSQLLAGRPLKTVAEQLAAVLVTEKKIGELELLISDVAEVLERRGKLSTGNITTASPLSEKLRAEIKQFIKSSAKVESVRLEESVDQAVLGGVRIETPAHLWDKTVARKLADIREVI